MQSTLDPLLPVQKHMAGQYQPTTMTDTKLDQTIFAQFASSLAKQLITGMRRGWREPHPRELMRGDYILIYHSAVQRTMYPG